MKIPFLPSKRRAAPIIPDNGVLPRFISLNVNNANYAVPRGTYGPLEIANAAGIKGPVKVMLETPKGLVEVTAPLTPERKMRFRVVSE
jgi:hypothetical protein